MMVLTVLPLVSTKKNYAVLVGNFCCVEDGEEIETSGWGGGGGNLHI